jgi:hypothetical protein
MQLSKVNLCTADRGAFLALCAEDRAIYLIARISLVYEAPFEKE